MTPPTNWPNPERPGAPLFPENYGKHKLIDKETGNELNADWNNADEEWLLPNGWLSAKNAATHFAYVECVSVELTPTQITEMLAGERERCVSAFAAHGERAELAYNDSTGDEEKQYWRGAINTFEECRDEIRHMGDVS
ncbi:hypothetical protein [Acetobacter persici]|uniref:Uncharacterized protein n=1 Tax=Acetobacter persici TaxID=1076596 RepID=A0A1U9LEI5_9PROT|nr:hypothetical protein [Acetobacter persici]AQT04822.1 hypothetical protein A0U91_07720 [Acetobacter persici]